MPEDENEGVAARAVELAAGLPAPLAAGGLKAITRLIGGLADYPAAWLRRASQGVEDGTNARTLMSNTLAVAAAERAAADPALVERAMASLLTKGARRQANREAVAEQTAEALRETTTGGPPQEPAGEPDDDWLNVFERYAEDASSERARVLWGRVLAGEIRKPRSFSLAAMRFLSEADQRTVQVAQRVSAMMIGDMIVRTDVVGSGQPFRDLLDAEAAGLVSGAGVGFGGTAWKVTIGPEGHAALGGSSYTMRVEGSRDHVVELPIITVTRVGREVAQLSPPPDEQALLRAAADRIKQDPQVTAIHIGRVVGPNMMEYPSPYWVRPAAASATSRA